MWGVNQEIHPKKESVWDKQCDNLYDTEMNTDNFNHMLSTMNFSDCINNYTVLNNLKFRQCFK